MGWGEEAKRPNPARSPTASTHEIQSRPSSLPQEEEGLITLPSLSPKSNAKQLSRRNPNHDTGLICDRGRGIPREVFFRGKESTPTKLHRGAASRTLSSFQLFLIVILRFLPYRRPPTPKRQRANWNTKGGREEKRKPGPPGKLRLLDPRASAPASTH